jgi:hypothetical protein
VVAPHFRNEVPSDIPKLLLALLTRPLSYSERWSNTGL